MVYTKKTWQEKLTDKKGLPKIVNFKKNFPCYNAVHKMGAEVGDDIVLVNPCEVVDVMRNVPQGKLITIIEICKKLAQKHNVQGCCSLTVGIFIMTATNATEEAKNEGKQLHIPYWRTLKAKGVLNKKYPGGVLGQKKLLEQESYTIVHKGKRYWIKNMEKWTSVGLVMIAIGILLWIAYGLYLGFEDIMDILDVVTGFVAVLIVVGVYILFISVIIEQRRETKKMREKIKKEDLEP